MILRRLSPGQFPQSTFDFMIFKSSHFILLLFALILSLSLCNRSHNGCCLKKMSDYQGKRQWKKEVSTSPFSIPLCSPFKGFHFMRKLQIMNPVRAWPGIASRALSRQRHANNTFSWLSLLSFIFTTIWIIWTHGWAEGQTVNFVY